MQSYNPLIESNTLQASRSILNNSIATALSLSSGAAFPTTNLLLGMACWRTDQNRLYILKAITPTNEWELVYSAGIAGAGTGMDADLLDGHQGTYYANVTARLGYTPANRAGDVFTGDVRIGQNLGAQTANFRYLDISGTAGGVLRLGDGANSRGLVYSTAGGALVIATDGGGSRIVFANSVGTERMSVESTGTVRFNSTVSAPGVGNVLGGAAIENAGADGSTLFMSRATNVAAYFNRNQDGQVMLFTRSGSGVGAIAVTTTGTAYNVTSDYRLKENPVPIQNPLALVNSLKPRQYNWKVNGSIGQGFIAHELAEVVPQAVYGEKDAVDANGQVDPQAVNYSYLVTHLTAALQELSAKHDALEARIAALEGQ